MPILFLEMSLCEVERVWNKSTAGQAGQALCISVIQALWRLRQEGCCEISLGYIGRPCFKKIAQGNRSIIYLHKIKIIGQFSERF